MIDNCMKNCSSRWMRDIVALNLCEVDHCNNLNDDIDRPDSTNEVSLSDASGICAIVQIYSCQDACVAIHTCRRGDTRSRCGDGYRNN
jgi:hypothetical protein